jgi:hypothetical protein
MNQVVGENNGRAVGDDRSRVGDVRGVVLLATSRGAMSDQEGGTASTKLCVPSCQWAAGSLSSPPMAITREYLDFHHVLANLR